MNISNCYATLNLPESATDEEIARTYKKLAMKYHPDRNRERIAWAHEAMININIAYSAIISYRFKNIPPRGSALKTKKDTKTKTKKTGKPYFNPDTVIERFIQYREFSKDSLYRYFQFSLHNLNRRETYQNMGIFNEIVFSLRKSFHYIKDLAQLTDDKEILEHLNVFNKMIFDFYRASECLNVIDSYGSMYEVEAYRLYRKGDESLHDAHKEIFYDRHNRGFFKSSIAYAGILDSEKFFNGTLKLFPKASWAVETGIKLEYAISLKRYFELFFSA